MIREIRNVSPASYDNAKTSMHTRFVKTRRSQNRRASSEDCINNIEGISFSREFLNKIPSVGSM